ncbi:imelysin family protein [Flavobacteriaceae bacterium TK19130]|nr:imelysin family protein [Thermobacterium salinum]
MQRFLILFGALAFMLVACSDDDNTPQEDIDSFNRTAMLENWADNIIIPGYDVLNNAINDLNNATDQFVAMPDATNLANLRAAWRESYRTFQKVSMFEIGKAEAVFFRARFNTYPTDTATLEAAVLDGNYNLELPSNRDIQGFPALDYLLNGLGENDADILEHYTFNPNATKYLSYLRELVVELQTLSEEVHNDWTNGYRDTFVSNDGSSASASVDKLTNDYVFYYEKALRAGKIGIPAGVFSNQPLPQNVESYYNPEFSRELALIALQSTQDFFNGKSFGNNQTGPSFKSYLNYLNTIKNGEDLSQLINDQFDVAQNKLEALNASLVQQIQQDNTKMYEAFDELQRNVILMKVDMLQAMDVNVDYVDTDGD